MPRVNIKSNRPQCVEGVQVIAHVCVTCPKCQSRQVSQYGNYKTANVGILRYFVCRECSYSFRTWEDFNKEES